LFFEQSDSPFFSIPKQHTRKISKFFLPGLAILHGNVSLMAKASIIKGLRTNFPILPERPGIILHNILAPKCSILSLGAWSNDNKPLNWLILNDYINFLKGMLFAYLEGLKA